MLESIRRRPHLWASAILLISGAARFWFIYSNQLDLVQDEAQYWDWTRHLQITYYSKAGLIAWIIALWTNIFGDTQFGVRFGSFLGSLVFQGTLYLCLARMWKRPVTGVLTLFIINTSPLFMALGVLMTTDNPLLLCWTACMFALYVAARGTGEPEPEGTAAAPGGPTPFVLLALFLGVGIFAKYTMLLFVGLSMVYAGVLHVRSMLPARFWKRWAAAMAAGLVIGFLPTLIWNAMNDFVGYRHVFHLVGVTGPESGPLIRPDRFLDYFGSQVGLATPWWLWFMLVAGWECARGALFRGRERRYHAEYSQNLLLSLLFWPFWVALLVWSLHAKVLGNWTSVCYVSGAVLAGMHLEYFASLPRTRGRARAVKWITGLSVFVFLVLNLSNHLPLPDSLNPTHRLKGWVDLGEQVDRLRNEDFPDPDKVFIFSENYDITAALAFYTPGQPRTFNVWLDRRMNQYDLWPGPQNRTGWDAVYVRKRYVSKVEDGVEKMFTAISEPMHYQTVHDGAPARKFTLFMCRNYTGYWPREEHRVY